MCNCSKISHHAGVLAEQDCPCMQNVKVTKLLSQPSFNVNAGLAGSQLRFPRGYSNAAGEYKELPQDPTMVLPEEKRPFLDTLKDWWDTGTVDKVVNTGLNVKDRLQSGVQNKTVNTGATAAKKSDNTILWVAGVFVALLVIGGIYYALKKK